MGLVGRGVRSLYGIAVHDSRLWQSTSRPDEACTAEGIVRVLRGSQIPKVGLRARCAIPVFTFLATKSNIAVPVVSLPVPAVVGTAIRGRRGLVIGRPRPKGTFTKSRKSASGKQV